VEGSLCAKNQLDPYRRFDTTPDRQTVGRTQNAANIGLAKRRGKKAIADDLESPRKLFCDSSSKLDATRSRSRSLGDESDLCPILDRRTE